MRCAQITVSAGSAFEVPIALALAGVETSVTVTAEAPVIESARSQIAATVLETEVAALPMNGRNFLELALLVPGVAPTNIASTQLFPETSAVAGHHASRSAANATCRTTSSSTGCRPMTMRPD